MKLLRIATRKSPLALWQAEFVAKRLQDINIGLQVELIAMSSEGDKLLDAPLAKFGGKGLFVKELERAIFEGIADIAVHSMKDMPVKVPEGLEIAVVMERGDVRDAFISTEGFLVDTIPANRRIGTSSLRRRAQLLALRPDLKVESVRGGVHTRLSKLDEGQYDALVLAAAGLQRMGFEERITQILEVDEMLPAVGQGALGIECRTDDSCVKNLISTLHHKLSGQLLTAERAMNAALQGGCQVPIAGHAWLLGETLKLSGMVSSLDGHTALWECQSARLCEAHDLGERVAESLLAQGAGPILKEAFAQGGG